MDDYNGQSPSAALRAYREIEQRIVTLDLSPGSTLTESALINLIGLGRTPVREAVQRLSWEGLVEVRPRSGISIAPIRPGDWIKALEVRRGVEPILARSAARFGSGEALGKMRHAATAMQVAAENRDTVAFLAADKSFDDGLAEASENPFAVRVAQPLQSHSRRFWFRYRGESGLDTAVDYHLAVIEAIVSRDLDRAAREAEHLIELLESYANALT